jgi:quinol monooxygenase YgiN
MEDMISVLASIRIKAGRRAEFIGIFKSNVAAVREEKGCLEYRPTVDMDTGFPLQVLDENVVTIIEKWENLEALRAHLKAPHMLDYREKVKDLVENLSIKVLQEV